MRFDFVDQIIIIIGANKINQYPSEMLHLSIDFVICNDYMSCIIIVAKLCPLQYGFVIVYVIFSMACACTRVSVSSMRFAFR